MLGLAVLFFLGVWVVITIVAMVIGWKFAKKHWGTGAGFIGLFLGFMLTMGGFIVYWIIEYHQIQRTVTKLCETEGGIKVYVTPEEWRKKIGEEEWRKSYYTGEPDENYPKDSSMNFNGKQYHIFGQINQRVFMYIVDNGGNTGDIFIDDLFFYDFKLKQVLYHQRVFSASGAPLLSDSLKAFKFWLDYGIHSCGMEDKLLDRFQYNSSKN